MYLNRILLHSQGAVDAVQLVVQTAGVAHSLAVCVAPPQRRHRRVAVSARHAWPLRAHLLAHMELYAIIVHILPNCTLNCNLFHSQVYGEEFNKFFSFYC